MKYKIKHSEYDVNCIVDDPKSEDLDIWKMAGCSIEEIKDIKKALLIGTSKLISSPNLILHLWYCRDCGNLFHADQKSIFKIIDCPSCKAKIELRDVTKK